MSLPVTRSVIATANRGGALSPGANALSKFDQVAGWHAGFHWARDQIVHETRRRNAAAEYDRELPPTVVVAFGNPAYGTPFIAQSPTAGIDFPPKAVVYEDAEGQVWIAYNSAEYLFGPIYERHELEAPDGDAQFYSDLLDELSDQAVAADD